MPKSLSDFFNHEYAGKFYHLAICVSGLTIFTYHLADQSPDYLYSILVGFSVFGYYNLYKITSTNNKITTKWINLNNIKPVVFLLTLIISGVGCILHFSPGLVWLYLSISGLLSFWYSGFLSKYLPSIHSSPELRIMVIALVYSISTCSIPLLESGFVWNETLMIFISRFCFIMALTLVFDIGGYFTDLHKGILSFAVKYGNLKTKLISYLLICAAFSIDFYLGWNFVLNPLATASILITYLLSLVGIRISNENRQDSFYLIAIDGLMLLPFLIFILLNLL